MTEIEMERARRVYDLQTRKSWTERLAAWWHRAISDPAATRRDRADRKAEVERKARSSL